MIILDVFSLLIPTLLHFSQVRKPILDREVQSCIGHLLAVGCKLARSAIKGHDTANNEGAQLRWAQTRKLVRLNCFRILLTMAVWPCVILLVGWPWAWRVADRIWRCRGQVVIGHWAPTTRGVTKVLGWCCWWCNWGHWHRFWQCLEGWHWGCTQSGQCWLGWCHQGRWPQLHCWPGW